MKNRPLFFGVWMHKRWLVRVITQ